MTSRPSVGVGVFIWKDGKFLMGRRIGKHGKDTWSIPGGYLEYGETFEAAAIRECLEETGLHITNVRFMTATNNLFPNEKKHTITIFLRAAVLSGEPQVTEPDKYVDLGWFTRDSMPQPLFVPITELLKQDSVFFEPVVA